MGTLCKLAVIVEPQGPNIIGMGAGIGAFYHCGLLVLMNSYVSLLHYERETQTPDALNHTDMHEYIGRNI